MNLTFMAFLGLLAGFTGGLLGVGGGFILVPVFYYIFKLDIQKAVGTSLALIILNSIAGSFVHFKNGFVDFKILAVCGLFIVTGSVLGALSIKFIDAVVVRKIFAVLLFFIALKMFFGGKIP